jgi:hypothetical protein
MESLQSFLFSRSSDEAVSLSGWFNQDGIVDALQGDDQIVGESAVDAFGVGVSNTRATIQTGSGADEIRGDGRFSGIFNFSNSLIDVGTGDDLIAGSGVNGPAITNQSASTILTGQGNDQITGMGRRYDGIYNLDRSLINTGSGNDVIYSRTGLGSFSGFDLLNQGVISMESGDDILDALSRGFRGNGAVFMGFGDDIVRGLGSGAFSGGQGVDTLTFKPGTYSIEQIDADTYLAGGVMTVDGFELFGPGANESSFMTAAAAGSVTFS